MLPTEVWEGSTAQARALRTLLTPLSWLYCLGWQSYLWTYKLGVKRPIEAHRPVLCIGNLVAGGSGKSPMTLYVASLLSEIGKTVTIGCSGFGSPHSEAATMAPDGPLDPGEWGDEPAMFRWLLPKVPIVVGRRRVLAANLVHQFHPNSVLLMDDGFQHLPLLKHLSVLLDEPDPSNSRCLPAGPYREPRSNRGRADVVLPGRFDVYREPLRFLSPDGDPETPESYSLLCALGRPIRFEREVREALPEATCVYARRLPDHDSLAEGNLLEAFPSEQPIIVTAKDWVKLRSRRDVNCRRFIIAWEKIRVEPESDFKDWLQAGLND